MTYNGRHRRRRGLAAQELREHDICVNGYAPGMIQTDLGMRCKLLMALILNLAYSHRSGKDCGEKDGPRGQIRPCHFKQMSHRRILR